MKYQLFAILIGIFIVCSLSIQTFSQNAVGKDALTDKSSEESVENPPSTDNAIEGENSWKLRRGAKEFAFEYNYAPMQPTFLSGRKEYETDGRKLTLLSFRFGRVIGTTRHLTYEYIFEAIPIAKFSNNEVKNPQFVSSTATPNISPTVRKSTYGAGFEPIGFRFIFLPARRLKPFFRTGAGFMFTKKPIPVPGSTTYNFIGDFGGGLMYSLNRKQTVNFGYRYFHISNMNIGKVNPGYNANVFYASYSFFNK